MGKSKAKRRAGGGKKRAAVTSNTSVSTGPDVQAKQASVLGGKSRDVRTPSTSSALLALPSSSPSVLRGIVSTNHDPGKCVVCSKSVTLESGEYTWQRCCGKTLCLDCGGANTAAYYTDLLGASRCSFCNVTVSKAFSVEKNEAHLGKPWAQYSYAYEQVSKEYACWWREKAAKQGHPWACLEMAKSYLGGKDGCSRDLQTAKLYAEKAKALYSGVGLSADRLLLDIAADCIKEQAVERATAILTDITNESNITSRTSRDYFLCYKASTLLYDLGKYRLAAMMCTDAFCLGQVRSAAHASAAYLASKDYALCKLWLSVACQTENSCMICHPEEEKLEGMLRAYFKSDRDGIRSELRNARDSCGGCGAALEGDMRKYCRGCKAYCYCSRDCQKMHWNHKEDSHRDECKEAGEHWEKIMEAIRSGKVGLSKEEE